MYITVEKFLEITKLVLDALHSKQLYRLSYESKGKFLSDISAENLAN